MDKICGTCKVSKPLSEFAKKGDRNYSKCKECHNQYYRDYWKNTEAYDKHKARMRQYKKDNKSLITARKYGITEEEYMAGMKSACNICEVNIATVVDHCHDTGKVRGFLCQNCNVGLGQLGDSVDRLRKAVLYLESRGTAACW